MAGRAWVGGLALIGSMAGCGGICVPGSPAECRCPDGRFGNTLCDPTGDSYLRCQCPPDPGVANCDNVLICVDCQWCTNSRGCSSQYATCLRTPGCNDFRSCIEDCNGDFPCMDDCAEETLPEALVVGQALLECTLDECPQSCPR